MSEPTPDIVFDLYLVRAPAQPDSHLLLFPGSDRVPSVSLGTTGFSRMEAVVTTVPADPLTAAPDVAPDDALQVPIQWDSSFKRLPEIRAIGAADPDHLMKVIVRALSRMPRHAFGAGARFERGDGLKIHAFETVFAPAAGAPTAAPQRRRPHPGHRWL